LKGREQFQRAHAAMFRDAVHRERLVDQ
jgi:hypothetical protein